jgi:hypothetical protein
VRPTASAWSAASTDDRVVDGRTLTVEHLTVEH